MSERFPRLSAKEVEAVLARHGFEFTSQKGSHRKWWHPVRRTTVIIPEHAGRELPIGTMKQIVRASGIAKKEWKR